MADESPTVDGVKRAIKAATKIATDALKETPSMSEITVEYQGVKITLKRNETTEEDDEFGM